MNGIEKPTLGPMQAVTEAAASAYARWHKFAPIQKAEILSLLQAMVAVELQREQRAHADQMQKAQLGLAVPMLAPAVADE